METEMAQVNWLAVIVGTVLSFGLAMLWFSPKMFGKAWASGSHNLQPPSSPPYGAMIGQLLGLFLLALVVGITATTDALATAILAILAVAVLQFSLGLFGQKSTTAAIIDGSYIVVFGILMIASQGIL